MTSIKKYLKNIRTALKQQNYTDAVVLCEELVISAPDNYEGLIYLAKCYQETDDLKKAMEILKRAVAIEPSNVLGWQGIFKLYQLKYKVPEELIKEACLVLIKSENSETEKLLNYFFVLMQIYGANKEWTEMDKLSSSMMNLGVVLPSDMLDECLLLLFSYYEYDPIAVMNMLEKFHRNTLLSFHVLNKMISLKKSRDSIRTLFEWILDINETYFPALHNLTIIYFEQYVINGSFVNELLNLLNHFPSDDVVFAKVIAFVIKKECKNFDVTPEDITNAAIAIAISKEYARQKNITLARSFQSRAEFIVSHYTIGFQPSCDILQCLDDLKAFILFNAECFEMLIASKVKGRMLFEIHWLNADKENMEKLIKDDKFKGNVSEEEFQQCQQLFDCFLDANLVPLGNDLESVRVRCWTLCRHKLSNRTYLIRQSLFNFASESPQNYEPYYLFGLYFSKINDLERACSFLKRSVSLNPYSRLVLTALADVFYRMKDLKSAQDVCRDAARLHPHFFDAQMMFGIISLKLNSLVDAARAFSCASSLRPSSHEAVECCGEAHRKRRAYRTALKAYNKALSLKPDCSHCLYSKCLILLIRQRYEVVQELITDFFNAKSTHNNDDKRLMSQCLIDCLFFEGINLAERHHCFRHAQERFQVALNTFSKMRNPSRHAVFAYASFLLYTFRHYNAKNHHYIMDAIKSLQSLLENTKQSPILTGCLAYAYYLNSDMKASVSLLLEGMALRCFAPANLNLLSRIAMNAGDQALSDRLLFKCASVNWYPAFFNRGLLYYGRDNAFSESLFTKAQVYFVIEGWLGKALLFDSEGSFENALNFSRYAVVEKKTQPVYISVFCKCFEKFLFNGVANTEMDTFIRSSIFQLAFDLLYNFVNVSDSRPLRVLFACINELKGLHNQACKQYEKDGKNDINILRCLTSLGRYKVAKELVQKLSPSAVSKNLTQVLLSLYNAGEYEQAITLIQKQNKCELCVMNFLSIVDIRLKRRRKMSSDELNQMSPNVLFLLCVFTKHNKAAYERLLSLHAHDILRKVDVIRSYEGGNYEECICQLAERVTRVSCDVKQINELMQFLLHLRLDDQITKYLYLVLDRLPTDFLSLYKTYRLLYLRQFVHSHRLIQIASHSFPYDSELRKLL